VTRPNTTVHRRGAEQLEIDQITAIAELEPVGRKRPIRILIADDDDVSRLKLERLLASWDYDVISVRNGIEAWEALNVDDPPCLAVLDWMMPGMDGIDIVREARKSARGVPPFMILLSGLDSTSDTVKGLEAGADDYIKKPFKPQELRARVHAGCRIVQLQTALAHRITDVEGALEAQRLAEEALQRSEERARLLFATIPHPVWVYDPDTLDFTEVNDAAIEHYGYSRAEFLAMKLSQIRAPEEAERSRADGQRPCAEAPAPGHCKHRTKEGNIIDVEISSHTVEFSGRRAVLVVAQDITVRKALEVELRHAQKLEAVGSLAAGIAHELNTPIQFVGDNIRFLQEAFVAMQSLVAKYREMFEALVSHTVTPELIESVSRVEEVAEADYLRNEVPVALTQTLDGVQRVATIVRAMKEFAHPAHAEKTAADLNKALSNTLIVARNEIKYVADVKTDLGEIPPVICNLGDMNQVFLNLLVNAGHAIADVVKGTDRRGLITVGTRIEGEHVVVSFSDTGCGIPPNIRNRIFDPFFTTKEVGRGTGQGLAIARSIVVDKHGGSLAFESEVGKGTTFFVRLPTGPTANNEITVLR
jgi:two-component system, NtrC family, sensor kinase